MAKKSRKPNLPQETLERARREMERKGVPAPSPAATDSSSAKAAPVKAVAVSHSSGSEAELREEYSYVLADLQNMGMLAAALGVVLVLMSFFI